MLPSSPLEQVGVAAQKKVCDFLISRVQRRTSCAPSSLYPTNPGRSAMASTSQLSMSQTPRSAPSEIRRQTSLMRPWIARVVK